MTAEGERWGRYLLEQRIGRGGMAEVFRARRLGAADFSRIVCVKRLFPNVLADPQVAALFRTEALTGARLHHPNIVRVDDFDEHEAQPFLVMEYVAGADLAVLAREADAHAKPIPPDAAVFIAHEVLSALAYAHTATDPDTRRPLDIVHRDVSPNNVLVSFGGEVKLGDFGIARVADAVRHTALDVRRGRLDYMPREQLGGHAFDQRVDLFALGVVLFELCTGQRPYASAIEWPTLQQLNAAQGMDERVRVDALRGDLPAELVRVIEWLVQPDLARRCPTAAIARDVLRDTPARLHGQHALREWTAALVPTVSTTRAPAVPAPADASAITTPTITVVPAHRPPGTRATVLGVCAATALGVGLVLLTRHYAAAPVAVVTVSHSSAVPPAVRLPPVARAVAPVAIAPVVAPLAVPVTAPAVVARRRAIAPVHTAPVAPVAVVAAPTPVVAVTAEPVGTGTVRVTAMQWGDVSVDGVDRGRIPVTVTLPAGEHTVRITGGVEHTERVLVRPGGTYRVHPPATDVAPAPASAH